MMEETSHGRHSNAVDDAAQEAKKLGADAVLVESHGSSSEPAAAFTNASITPIGSGAMVTGSTIIARHHADRATVLVLVEIPTNILYRDGLESHQRRGAKVYAPGELRSGADPHGIEQAIEILLAAKPPLIAAGDGIFWSGAAAELREFVELTKIPVHTRRTGQGAVAEDHPLAIRGPWKKPFAGRADAVLAIGFRFWSGEKFGEPPTWSESARNCAPL